MMAEALSLAIGATYRFRGNVPLTPVHVDDLGKGVDDAKRRMCSLIDGTFTVKGKRDVRVNGKAPAWLRVRVGCGEGACEGWINPIALLRCEELEEIEDG
jgi:hypothetical protein